MRTPRLAKCPLPKRDAYDVREVNLSRKCALADRNLHAGRLRGLQRAVRVREKSAAKAVKASKL